MPNQYVTAEINGEAYVWTVDGQPTFLLPMVELPPLVTQYVDIIETDKTLNHCTCEWVVHPDDVGMPEGQRRIRHGEPDLNCKVHTREGFILGFFTWLQSRGTHDVSAGNRTVVSSQDQMFTHASPQPEHEETKLTPNDWVAALHYVIIDNDGWTAEEWKAQEPCTITEFMERIVECTVSIGRKATVNPYRIGCND